MKIKLIKNQEGINELYNFIKQFPLDYPDYMLWVEKCKRELELGYKRAFVCTKDNEIIANLVFQPHKEDRSTLELKNARVKEEYERKNIFKKMVKEAERYARANSFKRIRGDTHESNIAITKALKNLGFKIEAKEQLYSAKKELILAKDLTENKSRLIQIINSNIELPLHSWKELILKIKIFLAHRIFINKTKP